MVDVTYVGVVIQGMALDVQAAGARALPADAQAIAEELATEKNAKATGESEGYVALTVAVPAG